MTSAVSCPCQDPCARKPQERLRCGRCIGKSAGSVTQLRARPPNRDRRRDETRSSDETKKEPLNAPYPRPFQNPPLLDPEFDADKSLPLIRYRILVDGQEDAAGECHCDHIVALGTATSMIHAGRYAPLGKRLAEVEVFDAAGNQLGRDRQVRTRVNGQKTVQLESIAGRAARAEQTEARVRSMGPPSSAR